jgi:uncharacterized protein (TIGR04222 family)
MNLNPFDLRGPEFLVFYAILSILTIVIVWGFRRIMESGGPGEEETLAKQIAKDPYQIAYLHGGRLEVLRVAVVSLLERGLLNAEGEKLLSQDANGAAKVRRPLDKAILTKYAEAKCGQDLCTDSIILGEADMVGVPLQRMKLIPHGNMLIARALLLLVSIGFLVLIAGTKICIALSRGHMNIAFLVVLGLLAPSILCLVTWRFRTTLGDKTYAYLQKYFESLKDRRQSFDLERTTSELTFLAAAFGIAALPDAFGGMMKALRIHPPGQSGSASGGCGSSCGGGGCGGGGCGGGCGGCG